MKRPFNKKHYDDQPKYVGGNYTVGKGGQIGAIAHNGKTVVELFELFCLRHPVADIKRSSPNYQAYKVMPIKMEQVLLEEDTKEGRRYEYWKKCPKCFQLIKEGEYVKDA